RYPSSADCTTVTNDGLPEQASLKPCRYWLSDFLVRRVLAHVRITANLVHQIQAGSASPSTFAGHLEEYLRPLGCSEFPGGTIDAKSLIACHISWYISNRRLYATYRKAF